MPRTNKDNIVKEAAQIFTQVVIDSSLLKAGA